MANIMSMKSVKNHVHRDGFDLSSKRAFSAKLGELLPVACEDVIPGDKFKISADWFTRTQPVTSPAFTRFGEYYDFFFVPYHLLWRYFPQFIIQTNEDNWATSIVSNATKFSQHPYFSNKEFYNLMLRSFVSVTSPRADRDEVGQPLVYGMLKLFSYLGYGSFGLQDLTLDDNTHTITPKQAPQYDVSLNPFPLCAYQKIYQDFYRNSQWEQPAPFSYNLDYLNGSAMKVPLNSIGSTQNLANCMFRLRYANSNKDYFLGMLPSKQYGSEALAAPLSSYNGVFREANMLDSKGDIVGNMLYRNTSSAPSGTLELFRMNYNDTWANVGIGALAIRQAEFLQKWKEITQSGGTDYVSQIQKHFGVSPSKEMSHRCTYIGGFNHKFGIDEVVNTNLSSDTSEAGIFGKGINAGHGEINFDVREHGIIMCVYHVGLLPEYSDRITDKFNLKTMPTDYVIPEMDNVGMQAVVSGEMFGVNTGTTTSVTPTSVGGYVPRYAEYKTKVDKVLGVFSGDLGNWVTPFDRSIPYFGVALGDKFYKLRPNILDSVFSVNADGTYSTDQFLVNCNFDIKAVRNISRDGLPY